MGKNRNLKAQDLRTSVCWRMKFYTFSMAPEKAVDSSGTVLYCCHYLCTLVFSTSLKNPLGQKLYFLIWASRVSQYSSWCQVGFQQILVEQTYDLIAEEVTDGICVFCLMVKALGSPSRYLAAFPLRIVQVQCLCINGLHLCGSLRVCPELDGCSSDDIRYHLGCEFTI